MREYHESQKIEINGTASLLAATYYVIQRKRQTCGLPRDTWQDVLRPDGLPEVYLSEAAADARCDALDNSPYVTGHNELGRPDYRPSKRLHRR